MAAMHAVWSYYRQGAEQAGAQKRKEAIKMGLKSGISELNQQYTRTGVRANGVLVFGAGVGAAAAAFGIEISDTINALVAGDNIASALVHLAVSLAFGATLAVFAYVLGAVLIRRELKMKPTLTKDTYTQSEVNAIAGAYRDSLTMREDGTEKVYSRAEVQKILDAIEANPKHRR